MTIHHRGAFKILAELENHFIRMDMAINPIKNYAIGGRKTVCGWEMVYNILYQLYEEEMILPAMEAILIWPSVKKSCISNVDFWLAGACCFSSSFIFFA